jgi:hypothetical protein
MINSNMIFVEYMILKVVLIQAILHYTCINFRKSYMTPAIRIRDKRKGEM